MAGVDENTEGEILNLTDFTLGSLPIRYLVLPSPRSEKIGVPTTQDEDYRQDQGCHHKTLSLCW